ncbi:MAG: ABC1 kinase family protein [Dehalococcoidia bacterium]|nr:ABC1 kinase family protein [Dehalococcoidia bacterium]
MDSRERIRRFLAVSTLAARIYLGYKAITVRQQRFNLSDKEAAAGRRAHHAWSAHQIYDLAVRQQGLLIKFGQIVGSRPDLIPDEYVDALSRLQDQVPPRPFPVIERQVTRELGRPLADVFSAFETEPIASASLAQVHKATLKDGRTVAVKVQYPGIWDVVETDLDSIRFLLRILAALERNLDFGPIIQEVSRNVPQELDFINEGHNAELIAANFASRSDIVVPLIYWEYTTRRVLVMEFLEGIKITDVDALQDAGIDLQAVSQLVTDAYCEQLFLHGMFHADPHPGNLFVRPGPQLVMLDFGLCRKLDDQFRLGYAKLVNAMITANAPEMVQAFRDLGFRTKRAEDPTPYLMIGRAFMESSQPGRAYADPDLVAEANGRMARAIRANPLVEIPREFLLIMRVTGLLSGLGKRLESRVDVLATLLPYTKAALEGAR